MAGSLSSRTLRSVTGVGGSVCTWAVPGAQLVPEWRVQRFRLLRHYLEALGARLELIAVFDDEDRRVPINLGRESAA